MSAWRIDCCNGVDDTDRSHSMPGSRFHWVNMLLNCVQDCIRPCRRRMSSRWSSVQLYAYRHAPYRHDNASHCPCVGYAR